MHISQPPTDYYLSSRAVVGVGVGFVLYTFPRVLSSCQDGLQPYDSDASQEAVGIKVADVRMLSVYEASLINRLKQLRL